MASVWGAGLLELGKSIRGVQNEINKDKERKKKEKDEDYLSKLREYNLGGMERSKQKEELDASLREQALEDYARWKRDTIAAEKQKEVQGDLEKISIPENVKTTGAGESTPVPTDQYSDINKLLKLAETPKAESMQEYGVVKGAGYDPGIRAEVEPELRAAKKSGGGVLGSYYELKKRDAQELVDTKYPNASPEEKTQRVMDILMSPSGVYKHSQTGIAGEEELTTKKKLAGLTSGIIGKEAQLAGAKSAASTTAKEYAIRDVQSKFPQLNPTAAKEVGASAFAIKNIQALINALQRGDAGYFDVTKAGEFVNPEVNEAFRQVRNVIARGDSGAAINEKEWVNFGKDTLNKNYLLTDKGKATALAGLQERLALFDSKGRMNTGDDNWFTTYISKEKAGAGKIKEALTPETPTVKKITASERSDALEAEKWARDNMSDPRAKEILRRLGKL